MVKLYQVVNKTTNEGSNLCHLNRKEAEFEQTLMELATMQEYTIEKRIGL